MSAIRGGEGEEPEFALKEIVWAKIIGYPWWPAKVTQLPTSCTDNFRVDFFYDHSHAFVGPNKIMKYEEMRNDMDLNRYMQKGLRRAVVEADKLFQQKTSPRTAPQLPQAPVEELVLNQKQLLKSPPVSLLQENINLIAIAQQPEQLSKSEDLSDESEEVPSQHSPYLNYTREQREKYVSTLLKKYKLTSLPKMESEHTSRRRPKILGASKRRSRNGRHNEPKTKMISKLPYPMHSFSFLLTRKIYSFLRNKADLSSCQKKIISSSLSKQLLGEGGGAEDVTGLFKWLTISPSSTIANFYQNWSCIQGEKEKGSNMTTEQ